MKRHQQGIALLEALIAVVILAIGLLGAIGLQARAYSALSDAGMRAEATIAADSLLGTMLVDQTNLALYALPLGATPNPRLLPWLNQTKAAIPGAAVEIAVTPLPASTNTEVDIKISWTRKNGGPTNQHMVTSYIAPST